MFGGGGGGGQRPVVQQAPPPPVETDPNVQNKRAIRLTNARYARGFLSTIQAGDKQNLGTGSIATSPNALGSVQKLG